MDLWMELVLCAFCQDLNFWDLKSFELPPLEGQAMFSKLDWTVRFDRLDREPDMSPVWSSAKAGE